MRIPSYCKLFAREEGFPSFFSLEFMSNEAKCLQKHKTTVATTQRSKGGPPATLFLLMIPSNGACSSQCGKQQNDIHSQRSSISGIWCNGLI